MTVLVGRADGGARDEYVEKDHRLRGEWTGLHVVFPRDYECGYCGKEVGTSSGYYTYNGGSSMIAICSRCNRPTFFDEDEARRYPSSVPGKPIRGVSPELSNLYDEARHAAAAGAYTAAVMACRKMLMNIAVSQGASKEEGLGFKVYVEHLESKQMFSPNMKTFVDYIKDQGNEANHQIAPKTEEDALLVIEFVGGLIRYNFELPGKLLKKLETPEEEVSEDITPVVLGNGPNPRPA